MQKPKLYYLRVLCKKKENGLEEYEVTYKIFTEFRHYNFDHLSVGRERKVISNKLDDYEDFIKRNDLSMLHEICFIIDKNTEVIRIFNNYNVNGIYFECVALYDYGETDGKNANDILNFIGKIKDTRILELELNFANQIIPDDFKIPPMNSLEYLYIGEERGTKFISTKVISQFINNSINGLLYCILSGDKSIYLNIVKCYFENLSSQMINRCQKEPMYVKFYEYHTLTLAEEEYIKRLFMENRFTVSYEILNNTDHEFFGEKECFNCGETHSIELVFSVF